MKTRTTFAAAMLAVLVAGVVAHAEEPLRPRVIAPSPVEERLAALEQRVTTLEQQNAELRRFVVITGNSLAVRAPDTGNLSLEAKMGNMRLDAQLGRVTAKAMSTVAIETNAALLVKAVTDVSLSGARVLVNGGRRSVARAGDPAPGGIIASGSPTFLTD